MKLVRASQARGFKEDTSEAESSCKGVDRKVKASKVEFLTSGCMMEGELKSESYDHIAPSGKPAVL